MVGNGLVLPDRTPEPELYRVQKVCQPIDTTAVDAAAGRLRVRNDYDFRGLDKVEVAWDVTEDGRLDFRASRGVAFSCLFGDTWGGDHDYPVPHDEGPQGENEDRPG
jgi:hypothetical protein